MTIGRNDRQHLAVHSMDRPVISAAQSRRVLQKRLQHRLQVERRAANDFKHFAGRGLLIEGLREIAIACPAIP